jgi:hypothetical protein
VRERAAWRGQVACTLLSEEVHGSLLTARAEGVRGLRSDMEANGVYAVDDHEQELIRERVERHWRVFHHGRLVHFAYILPRCADAAFLGQV